METTCPMKSRTPRGGKGRWPSSELTLCTFGWKASGTTSTWIWKLPASWWRLDFSYRLWERGALSRCRLSRLRISVFIKAPYDPTKIPQWLFRPAKVWWVQLLPHVVRPQGQGCGEGSKWQDLGSFSHYCSTDSFDLSKQEENCQAMLSKICWALPIPNLETEPRFRFLLSLVYNDCGRALQFENCVRTYGQVWRLWLLWGWFYSDLLVTLTCWSLTSTGGMFSSWIEQQYSTDWPCAWKQFISVILMLIIYLQIRAFISKTVVNPWQGSAGLIGLKILLVLSSFS